MSDDLRLAWLEERVCLSLKCKAALFRKLDTEGGANRPLLDFLNTADAAHVYLTDGPKGLLCFDQPPANTEKKVLYFLKHQKTALTPENMDEVVIVGELAQGGALAHIYRTCQEVYLPLLSNKSNQEGWPDVISHELVDSFHKLVASIYVTIGHAQGKTLLPLPAVQLSSADRTSKDKERVHVLETAVVTWTRQIKSVLKQDPEQVLKSGAHPGPLEELSFWRSKANNLNSIHEQLQGEKIRKVVRVLDLTKSTYYPAFNRLCKEAAAACAEAHDNVRHLEPLRLALEKMGGNGDFASLVDDFRPVLHLVMLTWKNSKHYNTPARLVVLIREICNDVIRQACAYLDAEALLTMEPPEAVERLVVALRVCGFFKSVYFDYKARTSAELPSNPWRVQNTALFPRLDAFLERCHDLLDLCKTVVQFQKLEKVEVGGNKGRTLSASVNQIYGDFTCALKGFKKLPYNVLDVEVKRFDDDFYQFRCEIKELERRLGSVLNQGFEDCATVFAAFKLLESFEGLLEREFIQADLERKHIDLLKAYAHDLKDVQDTFNVQKTQSAPGKYLERPGPPLYVNMPPVSGTIFWLRGLVARIEEPMHKLRQTMKLMLDSDEAREVHKLHHALLGSLRDFEAQQFAAWGVGVDAVSQSKLKKPLLTRNEASGLVAVNFDPALVRLLREVKYLIPMGKDIPKAALELHAKSETFRVQIGNLELIVGKYNQVTVSMLDVEQPLLHAQLKAIDKVLEKGVRHLTWRSHAIDDFVREATALVKEAFDTLNALKANMHAIQDVVCSWVDKPLMKRPSAKTYSPDEFEEELAAHLSARYAEVSEGGKEVHKLLLASNRVLKISKGSPLWKAYVEFINDIIVDGLARTVANSLQYLNDQQDPLMMAEQESAPLLEVTLELALPEVIYQPQLTDADTTSPSPSVRARVDGWVRGFFHVCKLVKRLDRTEGDFLKEVVENEAVRFYVHSIQQHAQHNALECADFKAPFMQYSDLWTRDISHDLETFLRDHAEAHERPAADDADDGLPTSFKRDDNAEAAAAVGGREVDRLLTTPPEPPLALFDEKIIYYKELASHISGLPGSGSRGFLKVDARPVKQALATWVTKWMFAYTQHVQDCVLQSLDALTTFMERANAGLLLEVEAGDVDGLVSAMTIIRDVRLRTETVDGLFEPLRGKVNLLKKYGISLPDSAVEVLNQAPFRWEDTKKASLNARERLAPLQALQADKIKAEADAFGSRVMTFRADFLREAPFAFVSEEQIKEGCGESYELIDAWHLRISQIEIEAAVLQQREQLFDVIGRDLKEIRQCRRELLWLKGVWDHVELLTQVFLSWRQTLWAAVDVERMLMAANTLQKELKAWSSGCKQSRAWGVYAGLAQMLADMQTSLPLVHDLQDESMRERHWKKLMRICGRTFVMDERMSLQHLLALNLQDHVDSVAETVEQARMELKIDKQLARIDATWMELRLEYEPFKNTGVMILRPAHLVIEALDDNEVALQNMMGNRFMVFFEAQINTWKSKLSQVRAVLESWMEVQRQWCSLEAIFVGSEDIREQLPQDAKRFDAIDASFKEQMTDAAMTPNPLDACLRDGRDDEFERCLQMLELCQRSLSDYLETKRKRFPRFYFISSPDLIDVLSKGKHPPAVQEHFYKFTDSIAGMGWLDSPEQPGQQLGVADRMLAGDGEVVPFGSPCECRGAVEDWLSRLMRHSASALRDQLADSLNAYMEMPRDKWIGEYCAQLVLTTSQVWWTSEVNASFGRLEQGNEGALKDYCANVVTQLNALTQIVLGELSSGDRSKIKSLITIEVHARDVLQRLVDERVESASAFQWQSQLTYRWDEERKDCFINICDAEFQYSYEYTGNCGRLVITALTDRCYITLTQAMRLVLGGAPAGPAGTGKTETTKDLGRGLAIWVIVQNCSDQMNCKTMANIFSGLAQTGAWGCFDEFNRIPVEVLSVVAGQYSSILDAIRANKADFIFEEETISLTPTIGAFITMNPGYAGRTELPENLKALFRPCAMVVPDFVNICEIELAAEGFMHARVLAVKFVTLFSLNSELLSKQDHYDWGLRAMKGVLRIAGGQKRANPERTELEILMRALRDSNLPKFVQQDVGIFMGLLGDLFPKVEATKVPNAPLVDAIKAVISDEGRLQPEEAFVSKTVDLADLLSIRHCVFLLGAAGAGKTQVWQTLQSAQTKLGAGSRSLSAVLNPKAVTSDELYGYVHPTTKEYNDGIIARIMRDLSKSQAAGYKWIVLDGDIDAEWIESMNTVMDDNKVLTLVSNERIPLTSSMRLIFEISHLRNASPATVSRAGVLYLNEADVGWQPFVQSWIDMMGSECPHLDQKATATLEALFSSYVTPALEQLRKEKWRHVTLLADMSLVHALCSLLEGMLTLTNVPKGSEKEAYEAYFNVAAVWAFGGALGVDKASDLRKLFSEWWRAAWGKSTFRFPEEGLVFDYTVDTESKKAVHWREFIPGYTHATGEQAAFASIVVPTMDTTRLTYLMDLLAARHKPLMLVGNSGSAKTTIVNDKLSQLPAEMLSFTINFNSYTDAATLQSILEQPLEKKTGSMFGPPGTKRLIYFVDDLNMPTPDKYGTQSAIELLRQQVDYGGFYDLKKLTMKIIDGVQYLGCMNPTAGSFCVIDRMQRHFTTFACPFPEQGVLRTIYLSILQGHLANFDPDVARLAEGIIGATLVLHAEVADAFLPTAVKFHYQWSLRELSAVVQGLCSSARDFYEQPMQLVRLWLHEVSRVYGDRLVSEQDCARFEEHARRASQTFFEDLNQDALHVRPLAYASFANPHSDEKVYLPISDGEKMRRLLEAKLLEYNESHQRMDLVLFGQAMEHVCRISRIIDNPRGNALLVGVGGSGKQSLTRLAAFIGGHASFQIKLTQDYTMGDFKHDVFSLYSATGLKGASIVWLFTDQQIVNERMLVHLNDLLSTGYIPDLYSADDKDNIINAIRPEVRQAGLMDSRENCWEFFIDKVRSNLHVVLCMSPVGDAFRLRCRKFPALTNCTAIDWFHPWPRDALISVALRFLEGVSLGGDDESGDAPHTENVAHHMAFVHEAVGAATTAFALQERRQVYTTPKSFLELIGLYKRLMAEKTAHLQGLKLRLETGLVKLRSSAAQVAEMQLQLRDDLVVVEAKKAETDALLVQVGQESAVADEQAELGASEEAKVAKVQTEVSAFEAQCSADLAAAEPAIIKAAQALESLDKKSLVELKSLTQPPKEVESVIAAVIYMTAKKGANLKKLDISWNGGKKMMGSADAFLQMLMTFDKDNLPLENKAEVRKYTGPPARPDPTFNYDAMKSKSLAAAGLCDWVVNICTYHDILLEVEPKRKMLQEAQAELQAANGKLSSVREKVSVLQQRKRLLQEQLVLATEEKNALVETADRTAKRLNLAERLVNGLKDENERWGGNIESLDEQAQLLVGDAMVAAPFIAYVGPFNQSFRESLLREQWLPDLTNREIPASPLDEIDVLRVLCDEAQIAAWKTEGLPSDRLSLENAAIIANCNRWPLMIDPQLQGVQWIRKREAANGLIAAQQSQPGYLSQLQRAMEEGSPMLFEAVGESFDAVIEPVLARATIQKGRKLVIKLGDKEVYLQCKIDPSTGQPTDQPLFRLYLQTKLPNPHYAPEIQAQCTLVNFSVTERGLEDQLLAVVVLHERCELEEQRAALVNQQNAFTIRLKELEDDLLQRLANAEGDILGDEALIISLEETKATSIEIGAKVREGERAEVEIAASREAYRPVAARGALIFFLLEQLHVIDHMYQFSLDTFNYMYRKALGKAPRAEGLEERSRTTALLDSCTYTLYAYVARGLFERHRIIFSSQLAIKVLTQVGELTPEQLEVMIRAPKVTDAPDRPDNMLWLSPAAWAAVHSLAEQLEAFEPLPADMEGSWKRWKEWCDLEQPESEPLPQEWKRLPGFERLLLVNALRPDRMILAVRGWVRDELGAKYVNAIPFDLGACYEDSGAATPIFFLLSPGVDPVVAVKALGKARGFTEEDGTFFSVSLGQGQEPVAEKALDRMHASGGWVMLQNIELVARWLPALETQLELLAHGAHADFRVFLSSLPQQVVPVQILQNSIKLTNEPPSGLRPNMLRAYASFGEDVWDGCGKQAELKAIIFALTFFHSVVCERRKFGPIGWNRDYPFNEGDLSVCITVCSNYLNESPKVPWDDLRYIFGEIMYGGHITDNWDRRLCATYLSTYLRDELLDGMALFPSFDAPPNMSYKGYVEYIGEHLARGSSPPVAFGLHPNSEISFMQQQADALFRATAELLPRGASSSAGMTLQENVKRMLDDILERLPELFMLDEIDGRVDDRTPYTSVFLQECERMNLLVFEMRRSLLELDMGLKGDLSISEAMEILMGAIFGDAVPATWTACAWPSLRPLASWLADMLQRHAQLASWTTDLATPRVTWLPGLFNPQAFLTAVMQVTARKNELALDKLAVVSDVTKKTADEVEVATREGAYIHGLYLDGARWDVSSGILEEAHFKVLYPMLPVVIIKAATQDKTDAKDAYPCPVYKTPQRGPTFVFTAGLKIGPKTSAAKWTIAGVALLLDVGV